MKTREPSRIAVTISMIVATVMMMTAVLFGATPAGAQDAELPVCAGLLESFDDQANLWNYGSQSNFSGDTFAALSNSTEFRRSATFDADYNDIDLTQGATIAASLGGGNLGVGDSLSLEYSIDGTTWNELRTWNYGEGLVNSTPQIRFARFTVNLPPTEGVTALRFIEGTNDSASYESIFLDNLCVSTAAPACAGELETFGDGVKDWTTAWSVPIGENTVSTINSYQANAQHITFNPSHDNIDLSNGAIIEVSLGGQNLEVGDTLTFEYSTDATTWTTLQTWYVGTDFFESFVRENFARVSVELPATGPGTMMRFSEGTDQSSNYEIIFSDDICVTEADFTTAPVYGEVRATVTCLAGNGRIDVNAINNTDAPVVYELSVGALTPISGTAEPKTLWRRPRTGRPDGPIQVTLTQDGETILDETVVIACDADQTVSSPEVDVMTWCIGELGMVWAQMANPTDAARVYIVEVAGFRRSTTAEAWGGTVRGVSGRPTGSYDVAVEGDGEVIHTETIQVDC